ncbi:MAG: heparinase II/III family protein [Candidatus Babeliales bacterium]
MHYFIRSKSRIEKNPYNKPWENAELLPVKLKPTIDKPVSCTGTNSFTFLNLDKTFTGGIDWNFAGHGKLWTYNLNYFDFLNQANLSKDDGLALIHNYIDSEANLLDGKEPYTTSLRLVNWLKFVYQHDIQDQEIHDFILCDLKNLDRNLEYHIMANHLLENAFALTIGAYCLNRVKTLEKGLGLLADELIEQICVDGAHFEKSPMYQQILLDRLLDMMNFLGDYDLTYFCGNDASRMLSWLKIVTFSDGSIPYVNDATPNIAPSTSQLEKYARSMGIKAKDKRLGDSLYRKFKTDSYELIADCGGVGPDYQPGHSHSDAGSFVMHINDSPFIVDTGISTYVANDRRLYERSACAHNTTHPDGIEPNEVWGSFRLARRETVNVINDTFKALEIKRSLSYKEKYKLGREFAFSDQAVNIIDHAESSTKNGRYSSYIHFSPQVVITETERGISTPEAVISFKGFVSFELLNCQIATGFNQLENAKKVKVDFTDTLTTEIKLTV